MNSQKAAVFWRIFLLVGSRQVLLSLWRAQFFSSNQKVPLLKFSVCNVLTIFSACLFPPKNSSYEFSVSLVLTIFFFSSGFMLAVMCAAIGSMGLVSASTRQWPKTWPSTYVTNVVTLVKTVRFIAFVSSPTTKHSKFLFLQLLH